MEKEKDLGALFSDIKKDLTAYVNVKAKLIKLDLVEKTSVTATLLLFGLAVFLVVFFTLLFVFLALGFWLGGLLGHIAIGMGLIALIYLVILWIMIANRVKIQAKVVDLFLSGLIKEDEIDGNEEA